MNVKVHVTKDDIDKGIPGSASGCPIALAIVRAVAGADSALVGATTDIDIYYKDGTHQWGFPHTPKTRDFVADFDDNGPDVVSPFDFELDLSSVPRCSERHAGPHARGEA